MGYSTNISTTATLIKTPGLGEQVWLENISQTTVYVSSNSAVTSTTGFPLTYNSLIKWFNGYNGGFTLYGITASGQATVTINGVTN